MALIQFAAQRVTESPAYFGMAKTDCKGIGDSEDGEKTTKHIFACYL